MSDLELAELLADVAGRGARARLRVAGGSMRPTLRDGDVVLIDAAAPETLRRGDVVAARMHGRIVIHRVESIRGGELRLRGDNRVECDPWIAHADVIGRVEELRPRRSTFVAARRFARRLRRR